MVEHAPREPVRVPAWPALEPAGPGPGREAAVEAPPDHEPFLSVVAAPTSSPTLASSSVEHELDPDVDDVVARFRSGALSAASRAYSAAHGHPLEHPDPFAEPAPRGWALRTRSALVVGVVVLVLAGLVVARGWMAAPADLVPLGPASPPPADPFAAEAGGVVVHVVGEVDAPGVVELGPGARVAEAVEAAGGATREADLGALNLARTVEDGEQIVVPREGEAEDGASASPTTTDPRLDLNAADAAALESLPGIGPVLAERILAWRTEHGRFSSVAELQEVTGIGPSLFGRLESLVRV